MGVVSSPMTSNVDRPAKRSSAVIEIGTLLDKKRLRIVREAQAETAIGQSLSNLGEFEIDDIFEVLCREMSEDDHIIHTV